MDRGAWPATVWGVIKSQTRLSNRAHRHVVNYWAGVLPVRLSTWKGACFIGETAQVKVGGPSGASQRWRQPSRRADLWAAPAEEQTSTLTQPGGPAPASYPSSGTGR